MMQNFNQPTNDKGPQMKNFNINDVNHIVDNFNELEQWADSRKTSLEIAYAIMKISPSKQEADRIWNNGSELECDGIIEMAREYAAEDEEKLYWGENTIELD